MCRPMIGCHEFSPQKEEASDMRRIIRYSDAFKKKVLEELKDGKWASSCEAARAYGLHKQLICRWMDQYGYAHLKGKVFRVVTPEEKDQLAEMKKEIKRLKEMLLNEVVAHRIDEATMIIACRDLKTTPEELQKKSGLA